MFIIQHLFIVSPPYPVTNKQHTIKNCHNDAHTDTQQTKERIKLHIQFGILFYFILFDDNISIRSTSARSHPRGKKINWSESEPLPHTIYRHCRF